MCNIYKSKSEKNIHLLFPNKSFYALEAFFFPISD